MLERRNDQRTPTHAPSWRDRIPQFLRRALIRWQRRQARAALEGLSDETLRDIGITRGEIPYVASRVAGAVPKPSPEPAGDYRRIRGQPRAA